MVFEEIEKEKKKNPKMQRHQRSFVRCPNYEKRSQKADDERFVIVYRGLKLAADEKRKEKDFVCDRPRRLHCLS